MVSETSPHRKGRLWCDSGILLVWQHGLPSTVCSLQGRLSAAGAGVRPVDDAQKQPQPGDQELLICLGLDEFEGRIKDFIPIRIESSVYDGKHALLSVSSHGSCGTHSERPRRKQHLLFPGHR